MADKKITELTDASALSGTENVYIVQTGNSRKTTTQDIADLSSVDVTTLDGDVLTISWDPANYTPDSSIAEASDVDDLAAHLKGIDTAIGNATVSEDTLDGDIIPITWDPANYTPDSSIAEASDIDDLAAHLKGIDTALLTAGGGSSGPATQPYMTVETYTLSDVDVSGNLNIDLSDSDSVVIAVSDISSDTSERPRWRLSTDGGSTVESGNVYRNQFITDSASSQNDGDSVFFGSVDTFNSLSGIITLTGHGKSDVTVYKTSTGTATSTSVLRDGSVETSDVYDTLQFYLPTGSFDVVDITVYKYRSVNVYTTNGIQVDTYAPADLETGDTQLNIDISGYDVCEIVVNSLSSTASENVLARVSADGGATLETGSVYKLMNVADNTYANTDTQLYFGSAAATSSHYGHLKFVGAKETNYTKFESSSATGSDRSRVLNGIIDSATVYDAVQFFVESGTFDAVDITVYRYNVTGLINVDSIDGDQIPITWDPANYTPDSSISEASDVDDLAAHLKGIDTAFGNVSSGAGLFKGENGTTGDVTNGAGDIFRVNEQTLNTDTTIGSTENASCTGPLTVATGVTLTVQSGGNLRII